MRRISLFVWLVMVGSVAADAGSGNVVLDSNVAFYDGESFRYILPAPRHFKMVTNEAAGDGYSFAFIPKAESYDSASVLIGINIYKIRGMSFDTVVINDTAALRDHYGPRVTIREVPALRTGDGSQARTFYLQAGSGFMPNAAMAYYNGGTELFIFELVLTPDVLRYKAEELFADCVNNLRPMKRGTTLGQR